MHELVIETHNLMRTYQTYSKAEGVWNSIQNIWKRTYEYKTALQPTHLSIGGGQIVGLVGANGAGKTTLLKLLSGLIHPSSGEARVLGYVPWKRDYAYLRRMSLLLGQKNQLWWDIPALDSFQLLARIYDLNSARARDRVIELARLLDCESLLKVQLRRLSLGERMKMEIIGSLLHKPDILFLDEPTLGLDVVAQSTIREFLSKYVKNEGPTVILTSHYMDDIAKLADRLLLISRGAIVYDGTVQEFTTRTQPHQILNIRFLNPSPEDIPLTSTLTLKKGQRDLSAEILGRDLPKILSVLTSKLDVGELKIEEANFEDIIRTFLESESRILQTRDRQ